MNKIRFTANETTNYVFHMLSVAKCGYDNAYGEAYRSLYPAEDLAVLKEHEDLLIICGGVHCGALYPLLISGAARAEQPAEAYYAGLLRGTPAGLETHADAIRQISGVMLRHCGSYLTDIWPSEREKIAAYIPAVRRLFEDMDFTEKAETVVRVRLPREAFTATLVTSVENGPEAIDISDEQDVFGIERTPLDAFYFIGHEFIIYLLFEALKETSAFQSYATWNITEGLAEFYIKQVMGGLRFSDRQKYVEFFEACCVSARPTPAELYEMGCTAFC